MSIEVSNVKKLFGNPAVEVLKGISFKIDNGKFVSLTGKSGSGKSTLLYIMSSLDAPTEGSIKIDGEDVYKLSQKDLHQFRNRKMGFVFQFHYLLPEITCLENVLMPTMKTGQMKEYEKPAKDLLALFGLKDKFDRLPRQLSGGEQQRVAIARAMIMRPKYLFADEPTGNLDSANGELVMKILKSANSSFGATVVMVTHDPDFAAQATSQVFLLDGKVSGIR
ncbi:MAG: ABC transporter ATP-binding protein [Xanthomonadaceae bacterium]|nr:ABC transporter ATP-binding protein [Xanthomonadaceae bacterium]